MLKIFAVDLMEEAVWKDVDRDFFQQFPGIKATIESISKPKKKEKVVAYYESEK